MGHTVWSQRMVIDSIIKELHQYGKALRQEDQHIFDHLLKNAFQHIGSITYTSSMHTWAFILLSVILEQEKRIRANESLAHRCISKSEQHCVVDQNTRKQSPH